MRRGWTTGACATAAVKAALLAHWAGEAPASVTITLPRGETPSFRVAELEVGDGWAEAGIVKDAGDDPDVTHGCLVLARVAPSAGGITFHAGEGVGTVTRPGLPLAPGEPAINPVPRQMMRDVVTELAAACGRAPDIAITISVPGGEVLASRTWNPRLGIVGGISILGTTGIVRPYSCAAWIASIHRGIDVARAAGLEHIAGCTGATSETAVRALHKLPEPALIDMGDFVGGMLKYLRRHPVPRVTIGGGIGKMAKLAQGAADLHSSRSQVDTASLRDWAAAAGLGDIGQPATALEALERAGPGLAEVVATRAARQAARLLDGAPIVPEVIVVGRDGTVLGRGSS